MVCKYKFWLMYNEYNLYFDSFTKEYPLILSSLNLTRTRIFLTLIERWIDRSSQQISSFELIRDLLSFKFFKHFECSSSSSNVLQVLQSFLRWNFSRTWASSKLVVKNERGCPLFIVILEDKLHFELITWKYLVDFWLAQILLRDNYLYLSILINIIFW